MNEWVWLMKIVLMLCKMRREREETLAELALAKLPYLLECKVIFFIYVCGLNMRLP